MTARHRLDTIVPHEGAFDDLIVPLPDPREDRRLPLRARLQRHGQDGPGQLAGYLFPIACVALEVTQRCNLDCTLCYLSDMAEVSPDPSLDCLMARIERIHAQYGRNTNIQITGGDPTLRPIGDLEALIARIRALGMRSALFTNGIRATRAMLERLARVGLDDVCFHVDLTQERRGYASEMQLNAVRADYLERAQGLGLRVNFNTTVHAGNLAEIPDLVRWFAGEAARINLASFQMQAETGRGVLGERDEMLISQSSLARLISQGTDGAADFGVFQIGHKACNMHCSILVAGRRMAPFYAQPDFFQTLFARMARSGNAATDWNRDGQAIRRGIAVCLANPRLVPGMLRAAWGAFVPLLPALLSGKRAHRLSFFVHNFMATEKIERARCESCVFMVMTDRGPLSMCAHNADRDHHLLSDIDRETLARMQTAMAFKRLKGRLRARALHEKKTA